MNYQMTFEDLREDIDLNPSVKPEDEVRVEIQAKRMRRLFFARAKENQLVSTADLRGIGAQYNARLYELRHWLIKHGLCIDDIKNGQLSKYQKERKKKKGIHYYSIIPLSQSTFYAERKDRL